MFLRNRTGLTQGLTDPAGPSVVLSTVYWNLSEKRLWYAKLSNNSVAKGLMETWIQIPHSHQYVGERSNSECVQLQLVKHGEVLHQARSYISVSGVRDLVKIDGSINAGKTPIRFGSTMLQHPESVRLARASFFPITMIPNTVWMVRKTSNRTQWVIDWPPRPVPQHYWNSVWLSRQKKGSKRKPTSK